jgi:DNA-binding IclR family transcriptional regulator
MDKTNTVLELLRTLARSNTKFITMADLCEALTLHPEECLEILDEYVRTGLLRSTQANSGEPYYWLTPQLAQD